MIRLRTRTGHVWLIAPLIWFAVAPAPAAGQAAGAEVTRPAPLPGVAVATGAAQSQTEWFPQGSPFIRPLADPQEPGFRAAFYLSNLLAPGTGTPERPEADASLVGAGERDPIGLVTLGETFPIFRHTESGGGTIQVGVQAGVTARFRLAVAANDMVAHDWMVGVPVDFARGPFSARLRFYHRSAHLGDEIIGRMQIWRVGFSHEAIGLQVGWNPDPGVHLYGGGSWLARSETSRALRRLGLEQEDRAEFQAGAEFRGVPGGDLGFALVAGLDMQVAERTAWDPHWSALVGTTFNVRTRNARLAARMMSGPSIHGEFFLTPETAWGLEFAIQR